MLLMQCDDFHYHFFKNMIELENKVFMSYNKNFSRCVSHHPSLHTYHTTLY